FGISAGYRLAATVAQTDDITSGTTRFSGGRSEVTMTEGEHLTLSPGTFGLFTNISYMLPLSKRILVLPELSLRYDLPSLLNERNWHALGITMGAGVMFDLASDTAAPPPPPVARTSPPSPSQRSGAVTAAIDLYSVDQANNRLPAATVHIYEVLYRRRSGMLGTVYFDRGSSAIPSRYRMISRDETGRFVADSLAGLDAMRIHYEGLNLLGARLRETPSAAITLGGLTSKGEPATLGRARAESIRRYLADIWGIDTSRVSTAVEGAAPKRANEKSEDGRAENRRVEVTGSRGVTSPIVMERTRRDFEPPLIAMDPKFTAGAGVKRWKITLTRDADTIGRYSSLDTGDLAPNINWQITSDRAGIMQTSLQAELTVEDSLGNVATGNAKLPLVIERNIRVVDRNEALDSARERITYTLLPFDYNSAELGGRNQGVIREIATAVRNGARIRVTGYADRTGSNAGNIDLSRRRAESAARTLELLLNNRGVRDARLATSGEGVSDQFDNDLPEGRALSREVEIVIEQEMPKGIGRAPRG
ncbi:MAG: OmpA family protein, partial [Candidatus Kapaibacterium sp.]